MTSVPRRFQRDAYQEIERLFALHRDDQDHIAMNNVEQDLTVFLEGHIDLLNIRAVAHSLIDNYDRARRPKVSRGRNADQISLFQDDALIPIGERVRVVMGSARREEVLAWLQIEMTEHSHHTAAHLEKIEFINESLKRLGIDNKELRDVWN